MSRARVVVHVGLPKTGTSFLQGVLRANESSLARHGLLVPSATGQQLFLATLYLTDRAARWGRSKRAGRVAWSEVCAAVLAHGGGSVISNELLCLATRQQARRVLADLDAAEVHVVVTVRDLARQLPAEWQEGIKHGRRESWTGFLDTVLENPKALDERRRKLRRRFWAAQDPVGVLDRWAQTLPPERVHVITTPRAGASPGELWRRFATVLDVPAEPVDLPAGQVNPSLGVAQTEVLRQLNRRFPRRGQELVYGDLVKRLYAGRILSQQPGTKPTLGPSRAGAVRAEVERWVTEITARGYDVIGDLDDLHTTPEETPTGDLTEPAELGTQELLDVSLDATGALLREVDRLRGEISRIRRGGVAGSLRRVRRRVSGRRTPTEGRVS